MADQRSLLAQEVPTGGSGLWAVAVINTFSDEELRDDLAVAHALRDEYGTTRPRARSEAAPSAAGLRKRFERVPQLLQYPVGLI